VIGLDASAPESLCRTWRQSLIMFRWLQFRFGRLPVKIHRVAFYSLRQDWYDVVIDFEKDDPEPVGVDSVQFRGWVRWLTLEDKPGNFILAANRRIQIRFGVMSEIDFDAFQARLRDKGCIRVRLALRSTGISAKRTCLLSREAIDQSQVAWPPRAAIGMLDRP
jgi:hypothetical protein